MILTWLLHTNLQFYFLKEINAGFQRDFPAEPLAQPPPALLGPLGVSACGEAPRTRGVCDSKWKQQLEVKKKKKAHIGLIISIQPSASFTSSLFCAAGCSMQAGCAVVGIICFPWNFMGLWVHANDGFWSGQDIQLRSCSPTRRVRGAPDPTGLGRGYPELARKPRSAAANISSLR